MSTSAPPPTPYVFVSYASADRDRVALLVAALEHAGVPVWLDRDDIGGGANYALAITAAIQGCAALVLMTSAASLASRNVRQELALAWRSERPYLPLLLEPTPIPNEVAYWLEAAQWVEVLDRPEGAWLPAVLAALAPHGIAPAPPVQEVVQLPGRAREQALLREQLTATLAGHGGLVLVGGEAGIGKTTLVEALLAEAAAQGALTLTGRCYDLSEMPPYGPWVELFGRYRPRRCRPAPPACVRPSAARSGRSPARPRWWLRCATGSPRSPLASRSSSSSTTCTGPTPPPLTCCAPWPASSPTCPPSSSPPTATMR